MSDDERESKRAWYRSLLSGPRSGGLESVGSGLEAAGLESMEAGDGPDLSDGGIRGRLDDTRAELARIVRDYLGDQQDLRELVDEIISKGDRGLRMFRDGEDDDDGGLETIARTDGSRPSWMIRNGKVDRASSPIGAWGQTLDEAESAGHLANAIACVGRIDEDESHVGTGVLIGQRLVMTNRHVLQAIAARDDQGVWKLNRGCVIDFGREFRARESVTPKKLLGVAYAGPQFINPRAIDHTKLDVALIEIEPMNDAGSPKPLAVSIAPEWLDVGHQTFVIGYPGPPPPDESLVLVEQLFKSTFGHKRLAPGNVTRPRAALSTSVAHDATTLGGNSGSAVLRITREHAAAGIHYGGSRAEPRENWGHVLAKVLDVAEPSANKKLRECFEAYEVALFDPFA